MVRTGYLFAGIGGAGKTTTARLWNENPGVRVVNDDHSILRKIGDQFRVYGTPWHGQGGFALAEDAPLKKIFILKQAPANQAVRLSPAKAAAALLVRTFAPLWDAPAMDFTLQFLDDLCQSIPCYELGFVPDQSAVEYVRCLSYRLNGPDFRRLAGEILAAGNRVRFQAGGESMHPFIQDGDILEVAPLSNSLKIKIGDVLLVS